MRGCGLTSLVVCISDNICDRRERNVTIRSEIWTMKIVSLGFRDIRGWVILRGLILRRLGCSVYNFLNVGNSEKTSKLESGYSNEKNDGLSQAGPGLVGRGYQGRASWPGPSQVAECARALAAGCSHRDPPARPSVSGHRIYKRDRLYVSRPKMLDPESTYFVDSIPSCTSSLSLLSLCESLPCLVKFTFQSRSLLSSRAKLSRREWCFRSHESLRRYDSTVSWPYTILQSCPTLLQNRFEV